MPWEGAQTMVAACFVVAGQSGTPTITLGQPKAVAGKHSEYGTSEPSWASDRDLLFLSDQDNYFNPWKFGISNDDLTLSKAMPVSQTVIQEDFGQPYWFCESSMLC